MQHKPHNWDGESQCVIRVTKGKVSKAKLIKMPLAEAVYMIWKERNQMVFDFEICGVYHYCKVCEEARAAGVYYEA